jgi:pimeloyl-ACP methyl ester carboxylesterase
MYIYFHGQPGSAGELALSRSFEVAIGGDRLVTPDRIVRPDQPASDHYRHIAEDLRARTQEPLHLIGFSLGAFVAMQIGAQLGDAVSRIELISPAAPLDDDELLSDMAGGAVFRMARDHPRRFAALTQAQGALAHVSPALFRRLLFSNACGRDKEMIRDRTMPAIFDKIFHHAFTKARAGYHRDVMAYLGPWPFAPEAVLAPVRLWHGDADNWSPPVMSKRLSQRLPGAHDPVMLKGCGHYTALQSALDAIALH